MSGTTSPDFSGDEKPSAAETDFGAAVTLREFLATIGDSTLAERQQVVDQALVLIEQLYVHLPLKRAMHAIDPVQRLRLLRYRLHTASKHKMPERRFHDDMISIFTELRDGHTSYTLPAPFQWKVAVLGFRIQRFFENGERRYVVSRVDPGLDQDMQFQPGVVVTHWNGIPIDRAVDLNADRQEGSNPDARHARGLATMTVRPMWLIRPPDEEWVTVGYTSEDEEHEIRLEWRVVEPPPLDLSDSDAASDPVALTLGIDPLVKAIQRTRKMLFAPEAMRVERRVAHLRAGGDDLESSDVGPIIAEVSRIMPHALEFRKRSTRFGEFGYLRIRSFDVEDPDTFVAEVLRIIALLPQRGLIVDVRGNPGGKIPAGERLLQVFTPKRIEPERLHFINTALTLRLCKQIESLRAWRESIEQSIEMATTFSDGFPILPKEAENCNRLGQRYHGPVVLITDALCYSTADIFAAGWQDHEIGPILGTDGNTGAGGANVLSHEKLMTGLPAADSPIQPLPKKTSFNVAFRRTTRVGERSGDPLEDLGVVPGEFHPTTRNDVLNDNEDLIDRAASILADLPVHALTVDEVRPRGDGKASVSVTTANISRLDAYLDGRPQLSLDVEDGSTPFELPIELPGSHVLELYGFEITNHGSQLVAARRIET